MMELPALIQEKVLLGLDRQIRAVIDDNEMDELYFLDAVRDLCLTPWDVADLCCIPYREVTDLVDRYELKAVTTAWNYVNAFGPPDIPDWNKAFYGEKAVPLFSPLEVFKVLRRRQNGDLGVAPPPLVCDIDEVLRSIWRQWSDSYDNLETLLVNAHDVDLLTAALSTDCGLTPTQISAIAKDRRIWMTDESLGQRRRRYWEQYLDSPLGRLREAYGLSVDGSLTRCQWMSPAVIAVIESMDEFRDRLTGSKWFLYKAVVIDKGKLPETDHNRMLAEVVNQDQYADSYFDFLKPPPAPAPRNLQPVSERDFLEELRRLS